VVLVEVLVDVIPFGVVVVVVDAVVDV